jgi:hypothetical protein
MPAATQIGFTQINMNGARCHALFSSALQPSDAPTADMVATAIGRAVQQFGIGGCAGRMAQEFGDHPDAAASRTRHAQNGGAARLGQVSAGHAPRTDRATGQCLA